MTTPVIGITPDRDDVPENIEANFFVRRNYCAVIAESGGAPVVLPCEMDSVERYLNLVDGIILTGGMFDIDPTLYGMDARHPEQMRYKSDRTNFEQALLRGALERNIPVLGICGGMQLIAVEMGVKLVQHIPSEIESPLEHKQSAPCRIGTHRIRIEAGSRLAEIIGTHECEVNSLHHQSVMEGNARLRVGAYADDGVIESIEVRDVSFCIGVQWHPEYLVNAAERNIFVALVSAATQAAERRLRR